MAMSKLIRSTDPSVIEGTPQCHGWSRRLIALDASVLRSLVIGACLAFWLILLLIVLN
jgi:hypothetical protein